MVLEEIFLSVSVMLLLPEVFSLHKNHNMFYDDDVSHYLDDQISIFKPFTYRQYLLHDIRRHERD